MIHYISSLGLGQPWVGNELRSVQRAGIPFALHAMRRPGEIQFESGWAQRIHDGTRTLYPLRPLRFLASMLAAPFRFGARFWSALANALFGARENARARVAALAHFFVACDWAGSLRSEEVSLIHSQWIHSCGTIGMYGAWLLGKPFSFTGHASDLFRDRVALRDKIRRAAFIVCISEFHRSFFLQEGAREDQLVLNYCGIDLGLFPPRPESAAAGGALRVLSSGRLVEKKGFEYLIDACARLRDRGLALRCTIAGSGPLEAELNERIRRAGLEERVRVTGIALNQEDIPEFMYGGDVYVLACVRARDGDIDGLPQMLMEAMACGLPVVSTRLAGIPDLVVEGRTGLLVDPRDADQLASAIQRLDQDRALARKLASQGRAYVAERFDIDRCMQPLIDQLRSYSPEDNARRRDLPGGAPLLSVDHRH